MEGGEVQQNHLRLVNQTQISIIDVSSFLVREFPNLNGLKLAAKSVQLKKELDQVGRKIAHSLAEKQGSLDYINDILYIIALYDIVLKKYEPEDEEELENLIQSGPDKLLKFLLNKCDVNEKLVFSYFVWASNLNMNKIIVKLRKLYVA